MNQNQYNNIILFDGICNLCNQSVIFIIKRDINKHFKFAALQSEIGQDILNMHNYNSSSSMNKSVVLLKDNKLFFKSTAALLIARKLKFPWSIFYIGIVIPKFLRDAVYNLIAKNRYNWFGKRDACMIPTPELKSRFL